MSNKEMICLEAETSELRLFSSDLNCVAASKTMKRRLNAWIQTLCWVFTPRGEMYSCRDAPEKKIYYLQKIPLWARAATFTDFSSLVQSLWGGCRAASFLMTHLIIWVNSVLFGYLRELFVFSDMGWITVFCGNDAGFIASLRPWS